ncbi:MAG: hypothetical protein PVF40_02490 [Ectothiorhodospiraceae bacterium]|jgi:hypothetical protein
MGYRPNCDDGFIVLRERRGARIVADGLTFDAEGAVWITSPVSNRAVRITADGERNTIVEDADRGHLEDVEQAYISGRMGREHLDHAASTRLGNISSLAFGGPGRQTAFLGSLLADHVLAFPSPVTGAPPPHWRHPLTTLSRIEPIRS